ncbi:MAG: M48 family metalloprotease [Marinagarivorans sp.]|nr:M48 family metalloprotease [Marinagarivorans sp.]
MRTLALLCTPFILAGCIAVNPVTGNKELVMMPLSQQIAMGEQSYGPYQQQQGGQYSVDPGLTTYVAAVGKKLAAVSDQPNLPYEFVVLNDSSANAWALPGGKIAVNRGLLSMLDDEAQLAAVLGHEIVHAAAGHAAAQMTRQTFIGLGSTLLGAVAQNSQYGDLMMMGTQFGSSALGARYGRDDELVSDKFGVTYMERAGYDPHGAVELQEKFLAMKNGNDGDFISNLLASHPPSSERVGRNTQYAEGKTGVRNTAAFQKATAQLRKDKAAYELQAQALKSAENKDYTRALDLANQAVSKQPKEALFNITQGQIHLAKNNMNGAYTAFTQAAQKNQNYFLPQLLAGVSAKALKKTSEAEQYLTRSLRLLPTPNANYYLGEIALQKGDKNSAKGYFGEAAKDGGEVGKAAQAQLANLGVTP